MRRTVLALLLVCGVADAQEFVSSERTYDERLRGARVAALGDDLFGDSLNRKDGTLQFSQTDVVVPTSSGMRVAFTRTTPKQKQGLDRAAAPLGASWEIDAPYMMGSYDQRRGWNAAGGGRCSGSNLSPTEWVGPSPDFNTRVIPKHTYWSGIFINLPAVGYESLLLKEAGASLPQDGATYIGTSASQWRVSCLPAIRNGTGEGFVVRTTDGTRYFFDWMAVRDQHDVLANEYYRDGNGNGTSQPYLLVPVVDVFLYATRVEDRHGNWVSYSYDGANPTRLLAIISNDGARIDIDYDAQGKIGAVRAGDRTWRYNYVDSYWGRTLNEVVLPDQSRWTFSTDRHVGAMPWTMVPPLLNPGFYMNSCAQNATGFRSEDAGDPAFNDVITMRHPSGAQGVFSLRQLIHGSDNTPGSCGIIGTSSSNFGFGSFGIPNAYMAKSLVSKTLSGPGIQPASWTYTYSPHWSFTGGCTSNCVSTTWENRPDGVQAEYVFGNDYTANIGDLQIERLRRAGLVVQETRYVKAAASGPYPARYGTQLAPRGNPLTTQIRPMQDTQLRRDGMLHRRYVDAFDGLARPVRIVESSTAGP